MARLLGIDLGTSGCKALLIDEKGKVIETTSAPIQSSYPHPGWSEQDPEDWWKAAGSCIAQLQDKGCDAIGLTGQMHGATFLDEDYKVIRPAILWNDQRTAAECRQIDEAIGPDKVRAITGNPPLTGFQLPKILWLRKHEPEAFARVRKVLLPKDYIRFRGTGDYATDASDASGVGALDLHARQWSSEIIEKLDLDPELFPKVYESSQVTGHTQDPLPVVAGAGDQAAGAVGTGTVSPGVVSISLGTSGVVFTCLREPKVDPQGRVHTFCHATGGWHAMGVMLSCGGALAWFKEVFAPELSFDEISALAEKSNPGANGITFLPYLTGERTPHNDPDATGAFIGLTLGHSRADLARAVFEGVTFGLRDGFEVLKQLEPSVADAEIRVTSGGSKSRFWMQLIADVFQRPTVSLTIDEGPALGAAMLAGVGIGAFGSLEEAAALTVSRAHGFESGANAYAEAYKKFQDAYPILRG